ncbi:amino acid adenylation domain-containing protein [Lachnospiraceae bacterium XBD2001]|nr:amino acid adenylation domain-containing protein [Lachnospiraceae bacterium XBD2001]
MKLVTDYLEDTAGRIPEKTALIDEHRQVTFGTLQTEAKKIATKLISMGIEKQPVVVYMNKSVEVIETFLGVAYSRNFYSPIDIHMPGSRVEKILETLKPCAVITKRECLTDPNMFGDTPILYFDELMEGSVDEEAVHAVTARAIDTDLLYVLFTSGSTGTPKGVIICHRSVIDYTEWVTKTFDIDETHIFGNQAPFYFDNSILDIYQMLKTGATMNIIPENLFSFPIKLLEYIEEQKINIIFWVPSALCLVANLKALGKRDISGLKKVLFCGEVMPNKQLNMWRRALPDALYANLYGPTEITDVCSYYIVDREFADTDSLPIGFPCENTDIMVINDQNQLVTGDEIGELCVRGTSLSFGYYNNPEKTEAAFVQNPLNTQYPEIIYRTGDLVKYNEYGEIIYCSRKDFQIKHMGHRIELGEIETAVSSIEDIQLCCCLYDEKRQKIVLFYTGEIEGKEIGERLKDLVPEYMIPNRYKPLEEMPINLNGKIDRVALKALI